MSCLGIWGLVARFVCGFVFPRFVLGFGDLSGDLGLFFRDLFGEFVDFGFVFFRDLFGDLGIWGFASFFRDLFGDLGFRGLIFSRFVWRFKDSWLCLFSDLFGDFGILVCGIFCYLFGVFFRDLFGDLGILCFFSRLVW